MRSAGNGGRIAVAPVAGSAGSAGCPRRRPPAGTPHLAFSGIASSTGRSPLLFGSSPVCVANALRPASRSGTDRRRGPPPAGHAFSVFRSPVSASLSLCPHPRSQPCPCHASLSVSFRPQGEIFFPRAGREISPCGRNDRLLAGFLPGSRERDFIAGTGLRGSCPVAVVRGVSAGRLGAPSRPDCRHSGASPRLGEEPSFPAPARAGRWRRLPRARASMAKRFHLRRVVASTWSR